MPWTNRGEPRRLQSAWPRNGPRRSVAVIRERLGRHRTELGDRDIYRLFNAASTIHENFYQKKGTPQYIAEALEDVEGLLDKLEHIMAP